MGDTFAGLEKMNQETVLPRIFFGKKRFLLTTIGALSTMPANKSRLVFLNPAKPANEKYLSWHRASTELIGAMVEESVFSNADQLLSLRK